MGWRTSDRDGLTRPLTRSMQLQSWPQFWFAVVLAVLTPIVVAVVLDPFAGIDIYSTVGFLCGFGAAGVVIRRQLDMRRAEKSKE